MRMTVAEAALKWNVNRRTVLKWMLGKDGTGRGKRLEEGRDFEKVETPRGPVWFLLTDKYPMPSLAPIQREKGIPRGSRPLPTQGDVFETNIEERAVTAEEVVEGESQLETRAAPKKKRTTRKAAARAESIPEASDTDTETAVERRSKRKGSVSRVEREFDEDEAQVPVPMPKKAPAKTRKKADSRAPTQEEVEEDVERAIEEEPMDEETRAMFEAERWLKKQGLNPDDGPVGGSLALRVMAALDLFTVAQLSDKQTFIERAFERKLAPELSTPARQVLVGAVLDYLVRTGVIKSPTSNAYYPPRYTLRGISDDETLPSELELRGLSW